ncbi:MAG: hypothetical protein PHZ07_05400 [Patescibacteria group bacterium]|nr:hypothetical protein [Patescibacteria group bacterium]MDD4304816.1 hypothetical protein [Patescibacteria group bacterium]MDD4695789.1 hypothetical protein [Patescibacteria group bacterium]
MIKNKNKFSFILIFIFVFCIIGIIHSKTFDPNFDPNYIISDFELEDYSSMSVYEIQYFLNRQNGILKTYSVYDEEQLKYVNASEIIYRASIKHRINPKYLLVVLQKEQSLITDPNPKQKQLDWATGFSICDSCSMNDPRLLKYKGFYNQVMSAAERNRFYIDNSSTSWFFHIGKEYNIDGIKITPANQATVNLYNYTPHINGNYNFWKIWQKWFTLSYPNGAILKAYDSSSVWLIEDGYRRPFITWSAFLSRYRSKDIINVSHSDLDKYPQGLAIKFVNYSYLKTPENKIYLLDNDKLRLFESEEVIRFFGVNPEEVMNIDWQDYNYYEKGENITLNSIYPNGAILQNRNGDIYYVKDEKKYFIMNEQIFEINYPDSIKQIVSDEELGNMSDGDPILLKDGTLVKFYNKTDVYVISEGKKRAIISGEIFESLGYKWSDVITVDDDVLNLHITGDVVSSSIENINPDELLPQDESQPL